MKNALVLSQSEVHNFFMYIIMHLIVKLYLTTHNEIFKNGKTYKQRGYLLDSLNEIVFFTVFQHTHTHLAILVKAHNCEANGMLDSLLTVNPDDSSFLLMIVVESELFAEDTYRHAPFPLSFSCN